MKRLKIAEFGNPVLRTRTRQLNLHEIKTQEVRDLISGMRELLVDKKLGIGLAANQVDEPLAVAVIEIQKTALRDVEQELSLVMINPILKNTFGRKTAKWEGCISSGPGKVGLFGKVPRYQKIEVEYIDDQAKQQKKIFSGLAAQVIQHEIDHLNGVLFVDRVKDTSTYMTYSEYKKMKQKEKI